MIPKRKSELILEPASNGFQCQRPLRFTEREKYEIVNGILHLVIMHFLPQIALHPSHQCVDLVYQHLRPSRYNHRAREPFKRYMRHAYISAPRSHLQVKTAIRYVREWTKKRAARVQGDRTLRWTNVIRRHVRVRARAGRYRCVTRIGPRREQ